jgi:chorismate mutase
VDRAEASRLLRESRHKIDGIDDEIIYLIKKRTSLAQDIANAKIILDVGIEDKEREDYIQDKINKIAREEKIDIESLTRIMKILTDLNKKEQKEILRREEIG